MLRLFNDCFAVGFLFVAIYFYQRRLWTVGSVFFTAALGVKMSILLILPAVLLILLMALGRERALTQAMVIGQLQVREITPLCCSIASHCDLTQNQYQQLL
jgi:alpha-1,3-mannosyltransferase